MIAQLEAGSRLPVEGMSNTLLRSSRRAILLGSVLGCLTLVLDVTLPAQLNPSYSVFARQAKARGESRLVIRNAFQGQAIVPLAERLRHSVLAVVTPTRVNVAQTILASDLYSWHVLRIEQLLSARVLRYPDSCRGTPELPPMGRDEVAVQIYGGETVVEGVTLVFTNGLQPRVVGRRYLTFLTYCSDSITAVPQGESAWFDLDSQGAIMSSSAHPTAKEVVAFGSISQLQAHLDSKK